MASPYDGFVSRHLNRRASRPLARLLVRTPVTPNQVSVVSLAVALSACGAFVLEQPIFGGLLAQFSSVVDGVDGDLARLKKMTSAFGAFMDSVLDRYADTLIILGLTIWAVGDESNQRVWVVGFWAMAGSFAVTYTRARIEGAPRDLFDRGITSAASRDVRLFVVMIGALVGQGFSTLIVLAALSNSVVLLRMMQARRALRED